MHREHREDLLHYLLKRLCAIAFRKVEEHADNSVKNGSRALICLDYILECRSIRIGYDGINLSLLLRYAGLDCRDIMFLLHCIEIRNSIRCVPAGKEWVGCRAGY